MKESPVRSTQVLPQQLSLPAQAGLHAAPPPVEPDVEPPVPELLPPELVPMPGEIPAPVPPELPLLPG